MNTNSAATVDIRLLNLENHFDKKIDKLDQEIQRSNTKEAALKRYVDKKMVQFEEMIDSKFIHMQGQMSKLENTLNLQHEYAEIKRQGEKLRTLEMKVADFMRDSKLDPYDSLLQKISEMPEGSQTTMIDLKIQALEDKVSTLRKQADH